MQSETLVGAPAALRQIAPQREDNGEADTAEEHTDGHNAEHVGVADEAIHPVRHWHKTGVGEGCDREIAAVPKTVQRIVTGEHESRGEQHKQRKLDHEGADCDGAEQSPHFSEETFQSQSKSTNFDC